MVGTGAALRSTLPPLLMQRNRNGRSFKYSLTAAGRQLISDLKPVLLVSARMTELGGWPIAPNFWCLPCDLNGRNVLTKSSL